MVLLDHTQVLREIMSVYRSSVLGDETEIELRDGFKPVLDLMVDAAVNMCIGVSEARHTQRPGWDKDIFILNCMTYLLVCKSSMKVVGRQSNAFAFVL